MQTASLNCGRGSLRPVRIFIVVSKNRPDLYDYFRAGFAGIDALEVILDRRFGGENAAPGAGHAVHGDRRERSDVYDQMESRGFVIMRLPSP